MKRMNIWFWFSIKYTNWIPSNMHCQCPSWLFCYVISVSALLLHCSAPLMIHRVTSAWATMNTGSEFSGIKKIKGWPKTRMGYQYEQSIKLGMHTVNWGDVYHKSYPHSITTSLIDSLLFHSKNQAYISVHKYSVYQSMCNAGQCLLDHHHCTLIPLLKI